VILRVLGGESFSFHPERSEGPAFPESSELMARSFLQCKKGTLVGVPSGKFLYLTL